MLKYLYHLSCIIESRTSSCLTGWVDGSKCNHRNAVVWLFRCRLGASYNFSVFWLWWVNKWEYGSYSWVTMMGCTIFVDNRDNLEMWPGFHLSVAIWICNHWHFGILCNSLFDLALLWPYFRDSFPKICVPFIVVVLNIFGKCIFMKTQRRGCRGL